MIVDAHEDLAWNVLTFGRDYSLSAAETRRRELGSEVPMLNNGDALLGWPDYQRGQVAVIFATLFAAPARLRAGPWDTQCYRDAQHARVLYRAQLDVYHRMVDDYPEKFRLIDSRSDLQEVLSAWEKGPSPPAPDEAQEEPDREVERRANGSGRRAADSAAQEAVLEAASAREGAGRQVGLVLLMEGAEAVREAPEVEEWWEWGVRLIGPAWAGNRFSGGTREPGPLTHEGYRLLDRMAGSGFILDISHMDEQAALQALDQYPGKIVATHSNALALLKGLETNRHLTDRLIAGLIERDGVAGIVPFNRFLKPGWNHGDRREEVPLSMVAAQIDYICQMAGDARHAGLGTDFDGGFGLQSVPAGIDTIADLNKLAPLLAERGYTEKDIAAILGGNWIGCLQETLP